MKYLWGLVVIFAGVIVYLGLHKPASKVVQPDEHFQESTLPEFNPPQPSLVLQKIPTHGENSRHTEKLEGQANVVANKSPALPQTMKAISPRLKGLDRIYEIEKRAKHGASNDEIAWLSYYEVLNNVPDPKAQFKGPFDENLMHPVLAFESYLSTCRDLVQCKSWVTAAFVRQGHSAVRQQMLKIFFEVFPDPRDKAALRDDLSKYGLTLKD